MPKLKPFDTSAFLDDDEVIAEYLTAALEDPNPDVFLTAIGQVAKARGMGAIAEGASSCRYCSCSIMRRCSSSARISSGLRMRALARIVTTSRFTWSSMLLNISKASRLYSCFGFFCA